MTEIIAEVGECFNGDMETAHRMIQTAKDCGCDVVKFQILDMAEVAADDPEYDWFAKTATASTRSSLGRRKRAYASSSRPSRYEQHSGSSRKGRPS